MERGILTLSRQAVTSSMLSLLVMAPFVIYSKVADREVWACARVIPNRYTLTYRKKLKFSFRLTCDFSGR